jgi:hypothetical protein
MIAGTTLGSMPAFHVAVRTDMPEDCNRLASSVFDPVTTTCCTPSRFSCCASNQTCR